MVNRPEVQVPDRPGVYVFSDAHGRVLYVGKARSLRSRLANYFTTGLSPRTHAMVEAAETVDWILADNDEEALMLEYSLIKEHRPRFNIRLRDDKSYPYLAVDLNEAWPRPRVTRGRKRKGVRYFGPYAHAYAIRETLDLLLRTFPARTCSDHKFAHQERLGRPCLYFDIERCSGPCVGKIEKPAYEGLVAELIDFLDGNHAPVLDRLDKEMHEAAEALEFEKAARLRDQLLSVRKAGERQQAVTDRREDLDVLGTFGDDLEVAVQLFLVRGGRVTGQRGFIVENVEEHDEPELLRDVLLEIYGATDEVPASVEVPFLPAEAGPLEAILTARRRELAEQAGGRASKSAWIKEASIALTSGDPGTANYVSPSFRGGHVRIHVPQRGVKRRLLATVQANAEQSFQVHRLSRQSDHSARAAALAELRDGLGLGEAPLRIECFDVSQMQGASPVASMVVFEDGLPCKSDYRRFRIRNVEGQDDLAMMEEALTRRFRAYLRQREEVAGTTKKFTYPPGLLLVDGGRGQLNVALNVLARCGLDAEIPVAGLAKRFEELYVPGDADPVRLPRGSEALYLLQRVRDEAHRFAIAYHRHRRGKAMVASVLDDVPGLGPARRRKLLDTFGSIAAIRRVGVADLEGVPGVPAAVGRAVYEKLHNT